MANLLSWLGQRAKAVQAQVNPFDAGQTYNTVMQNRPTPPPAPSIVNQIGSIGHQSIVQPGHTLVTAGLVNPVRVAAAEITHNQQALNNVGKSIMQNNPRKVIGSGLQLGTLVAPIPGLKAAGPLGVRIAKGLAGGAGVGATSSVGSQLVQTGRVSLKPTLENAAVGAVLGGATPAVGQYIKDLRNANQIGAVSKNVKLTPEESAFLQKQGFDKSVIAKAGAKLPSEPVKTPSLPLKSKPNPMTPGPLDDSIGKFAPVLPGDFAQPHLNAEFVANHLKTIGDTADKAVAKLSVKDQNLMQDIQTKGIDKVAAQADKPKAFKNAEKALRNYYDTRIAYDHANGIPTPYRKDYLRDLIPTKENNQLRRLGDNKTPGYILPKEYPGGTPVLEGLHRDIAGSSYNHAKLTYQQGLEQAFPGQITRGIRVGSQGITKQLQTPYGNELFATKDVANQINKRAVAPPAEGALGKYDKVNALLKYVKLGGGSFHAITEAGNFIGQQIASGKLFSEPSSTGKVFSTFFSNKALKSETARQIENGTLEKAHLGGLTWTPEAIKADINVNPTGKFAKYSGIKAVHDATFKREIPYMKMKTFEQRTQGLDLNKPSDVAKIRATAKAINAEFGGINRFVEGIAPQNAKRWSRILLASDFTESKITTMLNAISKGGEAGRLAREVVVGKALLFGALAAGAGVIGGELSGKNTSDRIATLTGKILDPSFDFGSYKVSLPATHTSEFIKPFKSFVNGSPDKFSGLKHYATGRLAAVPSEANQLINNQDYRGQKIYGGTATKPISGAKAALNIASGAIPIPYAQATSTLTGQQNVPSALINTIGLRSYQPSPPKLSSNPQTATPAQKDTQSNIEKKELKTSAGNGYALQKLTNNKYAYTLDGDTTVYETNNIKSARDAIAKATLKQSGESYKVVGNTVYRKDSSGEVTSQPKIKFDYQIGTAMLTAQKNAGDLTGWISTAKSQLDSIAKQLKDPSIDPLDALTLQNDAQSLQKNIDKYSSYGGFTKGYNGSRLATTGFKTASSSIPKPKGIAVKKLTAPKFTSKTRKLSVSKIPNSATNRKLG